MRAYLWFVACALGATGCEDMFGDKDAHPGTELGTFHVTAASVSNSCGTGALGSPDSWTFDVQLSRADGVLYWDNGAEIIPGHLAPDKVSFSFTSGILMDMRTEESPGFTPCSVERRDDSQGTLDSPTEPVRTFTGTLSYAFAPTADSECSDLVSPPDGTAPVFAALPCSMAFELDAATD